MSVEIAGILQAWAAMNCESAVITEALWGGGNVDSLSRVAEGQWRMSLTNPIDMTLVCVQVRTQSSHGAQAFGLSASFEYVDESTIDIYFNRQNNGAIDDPVAFSVMVSQGNVEAEQRAVL